MELNPVFPTRLSPTRIANYGSAWLFVLPLMCLAFCTLPVIVLAKQKQPPTKTIQGKVLDDSSSPIVGAAVQLTDTTTGKTLGIYTENGGRYVFAELKPTDDYQVQASYKGRQSEVRKASSLGDESLVVLNLTIPPPASQQPQ